MKETRKITVNLNGKMVEVEVSQIYMKKNGMWIPVSKKIENVIVDGGKDANINMLIA